VKALLQEIRERLAGSSETPNLDAQVLLAHVLGKPRAWVVAHPEIQLTPDQNACLEAKLSRLQAGQPLPYVLGRWEFFGLDLIIDPWVLIPRPETELLVERALAWLSSHPGRRLAADVGAGSGCIAVALAVNCPDLRLVAADLSRPALLVAQRNASRHGVAGRVHCLQSDLLDGVVARFDLICANLPYIPSSALDSLAVGWREPRLALDGGADGLDLIRRLLAQAPSRLAPGGLVLMEIEETQGHAAMEVVRASLPGAEVHLLQDLSGRDRLLRVETHAP
jgi:release factor glutamine methyltransferase